MEKIKLTKEEQEAVRLALKFYVYETTHEPESLEGQAGLPEGKEKRLLTKVITKLEGSLNSSQP